MNTSGLQSAARGVVLAGALLGLIALAGCEDNTDVGTLPPGQGTLDSPYIVQVDTNYKDIPMKKGGTLFFIGQDIPADWYAVNTASSADINLGVNGFRDFFGDNGGDGGSFTKGSGDESYTVLGDGSAEVYFQVDGSKVLTGGESFDVSIDADSAPASLTVTGLANCPAASSPSCESPGTPYVYDTDLPFLTAPDASLSVSIKPSVGYAVFYRIFECSNCGSPIPFPENGAAGYGAGYCHAILGGAGSPGTCQVSPVNNYDPPRWIRVVNNSTVNPLDVTLTFATP